MAVVFSTDKAEVNPNDLEATASHSLKQLGNLMMKSPNHPANIPLSVVSLSKCN
jgi:hypothetical protein